MPLMEISKIEIFTGTVHFLAPFKISLGTSEFSEDVIVKIYADDGIFGLGEAAPAARITGESQETILGASVSIAQNLIGNDTDSMNALLDTIQSTILRNSAAKAAFDTALYDLVSKMAGKPLYRYLGGYRERVQSDVTIGIMPSAEAVTKAQRLLNMGVGIVKMKVGDKIDDDLERVKKVRETVGQKTKIFIDANQAWEPKNAVSAIRKFEKYDIDLVEQPVKASDVDGLSFVRKNVDVPVMADEAVHTPEDAIRIVKSDAADMINIKLMKAGGIYNATKIAAISEAAGLKNMVGCMMEGAVGIAAGIHFALSSKNVTFVDLDSDIDMKNTLTGMRMLPFVEGFREPLDGAGIGIDDVDSNEVKLFRTIKRRSSSRSF